MTLVWFKRDLRLADHAPLWEASQQGLVLPLFVYEPSLLRSPEWHPAHSAFIDDCLAELDDGLARRRGALLYRHGEVVEVMESLWRSCPFQQIMSHRETGNQLTYKRDIAVAAWAKSRGVQWREFAQDGVIRKMKSRDGWSARWAKRMAERAWPSPEEVRLPYEVASGAVPWGRRMHGHELGLPSNTMRDMQRGGESLAHETLQSFLEHRGAHYRREMSSPLAGWTSCSRLSPYLAWGAISIRQVAQRTRVELARKQRSVRAHAATTKAFVPSLISFQARLSWHCHFMQKLEDEPRIEFENMQRACDGLRENDWNQARFDAFCHGQTGYPMVDACVRALLQTGWLNFRMRAMLVSFASHHLWLHWRPTAVFLGRHFLDFEPGIHFSQVQMQSGTTGINALRIYSPAKQAMDQDPEGAFIKQWVPELAEVPPMFLAEPHLMPEEIQARSGCRIGRAYPSPIVDHKSAYRHARERFRVLRSDPEARAEAKAVFAKHGSRKKRRKAPSGGKRTSAATLLGSRASAHGAERGSAAKASASRQLSFSLDAETAPEGTPEASSSKAQARP